MTSPWGPAVGPTNTAQQCKAWMLAQAKLCDVNIANLNLFPQRLMLKVRSHPYRAIGNCWNL